MKKTGAILVAAGLSSRMGEFKPLLPFDDSTISLHNVRMLKKMDIDPIVVVTGYKADELEAHLFSAGVRFVRNERYAETQMFDSVKLGIEAIVDDCERILIMPMDIPAILPETFKLVLSVDAGIVRTKYEGHTGHPIVLRCDIARKMLSYTGENGLKGAVAASGEGVCDLDVTDGGVRRDVDTPEDYQSLIRWNYKRGHGYPVHPRVDVKLVAEEEFFGAETADLLQLIKETGSKQQACYQLGLSYSKGSMLLKAAEKQAGHPLVDRWTGGKGGGGSILTEEGERMLANYRNMVRELQIHADKIYRKYLEEELAAKDRKE